MAHVSTTRTKEPDLCGSDVLEDTDIERFFKMLSVAKSGYSWSTTSPHNEIVCDHPECPHLLCPLTAICHNVTGAFLKRNQVHAAATRLGLAGKSLALVEACDNRTQSPLAMKIKKIVGLLG